MIYFVKLCNSTIYHSENVTICLVEVAIFYIEKPIQEYLIVFNFSDFNVKKKVWKCVEGPFKKQNKNKNMYCEKYLIYDTKPPQQPLYIF